MAKLKLFLYLVKHLAKKMIKVVYVQLEVFLTSVPERGELSVSHFGRLTPDETAIGIHWLKR
jgi:hypothetical protein